LSGGGYLGLYTAAVLAELEAESGEAICGRFDLIAGTSVGGIIALGLAAGAPAAKIRDAFLEHGPTIFSNRSPPQTWLAKKASLLGNAGRSKFRVAGLRAVIEMIVGPKTTIGDLRHRVLVPAVNLTKGRPQVFKTCHHPTFIRDWRLKVVDVALATSAAPTFFPLHAIGGELFGDGGLYANAPDQLALHEAEHFLEQAVGEVHLLSVGTTTAKFSFSNAVNPDMGWMAWMDDQRLPSVMIASQQINTDAVVKHRLGDRYLRIDQAQSKEQERYLALDVATSGAQRDLQGLAEASAREHLPNPRLKAMLCHTAIPPQFFHI
jgi:patatin-like phospholipase/acyl hydrolase